MARQSIGEFLAALRKARGFTQQEVADRLDVSNRTVSSWECNSALPDILLLPAIAELYGVTADEILAGARKPSAGEEGAALSERSERKLLKRKLSKFTAQAYLFGGLLALGLFFFFLGWFIDLVTTVWTGWPWWLPLLFAGLALSAVSLICLIAFSRSAETSGDDDLPQNGSFVILLRRKLALALCIPALVPFGFAVLSMVVILAGTFSPIPLLAAVAVAVFFALLLAGILLPSAAVKKYGGEEAAALRARNKKLYKKTALFGLIPILLAVAVSVFFAVWKPEKRGLLYSAERGEMTEFLETLTLAAGVSHPDGSVSSEVREYVFPLSELASTAEEGEQCDLGDGFSCVFFDGKESCKISRDEPFHVLGSGSLGERIELTVFRLYSEDRTFSAYNVRYNTACMDSWISTKVPQQIELFTEGDGAKLYRCHEENYFPLAAPISLAGGLLGVMVCALVCFVKREKYSVKL